MVSQSGNIFTLQDHGNFGKWGRGGAYTSGTYDFKAQKHRGIECNGLIRFESGIESDAKIKVLEGAKAFFKVGGEAEAGLSLKASFPLDLFEEAGVVAGLKAHAKASVFTNAGLELDANEFYGMVRGELLRQANSQWLDLNEIFFDEVVFEAGLWAMASVSAGITAEAFMMGCLLPASNDEEAGFTFSVQYSAGFKYGSGMHFLSNIGLKDPQRLLNRLSDKMAYIIEDALAQHISSDDIEAQQAMAYFKLFLPLATRTAFMLGYDLVKSDQKASAETSVVQSFVSEAQELLLSSLFDLAVHKLGGILPDNVDELTKLFEKDLPIIYNVLTEIRGSVDDLSMLEHATAKEWFNAVLSLLGPLMTITDTNLFEDKESWKENVALLWSAAMLAYQIVDWVADDGKPNSNPFGNKPIEKTDDRVADYVSERVNPNGTGLNLSHLVEFILTVLTDKNGNTHIEALSSTFENMKPLLDWLQEVFASSDLLKTLLEEPAEVNKTEIIQILSDTMGRRIEEVVTPKLLDPLAQKDPDLAKIINQVVKPALISIPVVVLPGIKKLDDEGADKKLREQVSAVLLLFLSRLLLTSTNVLTKEALVIGVDAVHGLADEVEEREQNDILTMFETFNAVSTLGASCLATPPALSATMDLSADVIKYWNDEKREKLFKSMETLIYLGVSRDEGLKTVWKTLEDTDDPPLETELTDLTMNLMKDAWDLLIKVTGESLETLGNAILRCGEDFLKMIVDGFKAIVENVKNVVDWLVKEMLDELNKLLVGINDIIDDITKTIRDLIYDLKHKLSLLIDYVINYIRDKCWDYFKSKIPKEAREYAKDYVEPIYKNFFNANKELLVIPLSSFIPNLAQCVYTELNEQLDLGSTLDNKNLIEKLKNEARKSSISDMNISVKFDVPIFPDIEFDITLPGKLMLGHAIDCIFDSANFDISDIVKNGNQLAIEQRERDIIQAKIGNPDINKEDAEDEIIKLFTSENLGVCINSPEEGITYNDKADLHVVLSGGNKSFVEFKLGVPHRVKLYINGNEYNYSGENWAEDGKNLVFKAKLAIGKIEPIKPIKNPVHSIYDTASLSQYRYNQKISTDIYVIIPKPIQFARIAEFENFNKRKWLSNSFKTIEEPGSLFYHCNHHYPYGWPGYKPRNEPVLHPGLNIVHVVAANGDEKNEMSAQAVRMFYLNKVRE